MALILNIDTALEEACLSIARDGKLLASRKNNSQKDHASWIHPAIQSLIGETNTGLSELDAIAISIGPGSYTGLRVGLATAKGLCYATGLKLIAVPTLRIIAHSGLNGKADLICPMIDARRMEVYTAVYDKNLVEVVKPAAILLDTGSFSAELEWRKILFLGNGSEKFRPLCRNLNAIFENFPLKPDSMAALAWQSFIGNDFVDVAYSEPLYLKEFYLK